jgi:serine/threonine protein kinase
MPDGSPPATLGRYQILSRLGAGGMGEVYLAEDPLLNRKVAVKVLTPDAEGRAESNQRMLREARAAARLDHPNVCAIHEAGTEDGHVYLVMQYLDGTTVAQMLREGALSVDQILAIARGVASALAEAHRLGIVHRDIKPHNVMVTSRGVKVLDFGLAHTREAADQQITASGVVSGTTPYMAPEQLRLEPAIDRSDVFSFGVMLFEMIGGRRPFDRGSAVETIAAILSEPIPAMPSRGIRAESLERLVTSMLAKNASQRPSMATVLAEIERAASLQDDEASIATTFVNRTDVSTAQRAVTSRSSRTPINNPAQQKLYARGRHLLAKRTVPNVREALTLFEEVIDLDPECGPAYAGLADCFLFLGFLQTLPPRATFPRARAAAMQALELDGDRADAHATLGYIHYLHDWNVADAERELREAIALEPSFATAHHWLGLMLNAAERFDEAAELLEKARELEPLSPIVATAVAFPHVARGNVGEALRIYGEVIEVAPSFVPVHHYRGIALEQDGRLDEAIAAFDRASELAGVHGESFSGAIHAIARRGDESEARSRLEVLRQDAATRYVPQLFFAVAHLGLDDVDAVWQELEHAERERGVRLTELHLDRRFDRLADRARLEALIERIGVRSAK